MQYLRSLVQDNTASVPFPMSVVGKSRGSLGDAVSGGIGQLELFPELFRDFVVCFDAFLFLYKETSYITFQ